MFACVRTREKSLWHSGYASAVFPPVSNKQGYYPYCLLLQNIKDRMKTRVKKVIFQHGYYNIMIKAAGYKLLMNKYIYKAKCWWRSYVKKL